MSDRILYGETVPQRVDAKLNRLLQRRQAAARRNQPHLVTSLQTRITERLRADDSAGGAYARRFA
jgi:hypothetical protein